MKRSIFLIITAIISALFGGMMLFAPDMVADGFGSAHTSFSSFLMREMGLIILCAGILNFLVRNNVDSIALRAILIFNIAYHVTMIPIVFYGVSQGVFAMDKTFGGLASHLFIGIGSLLYLMKMRTTDSWYIDDQKIEKNLN